jgi:glycerol-3-phosphate dehydrogenase
MQRNPEKLSKNTFDVAVVGGGVYGACIAWDAALRGLSVALIERGDFGQETSANSLKTVHGGLRYLQDFDLNLVRTMIEERSNYLRIAPHLVQPLACITPTYSKISKSRMVLGTALKMNDLAGYDRNRSLDREIPSGELLSRQVCKEILPGLPQENITGAALWHDAQVYDTERFTLDLVASAVEAGAEACNYVEAIGFIRRGDRIEGITATDKLTGEVFEIRSRVVVNAAGPWIDQVLDQLNGNPGPRIFQHSLAINIITRQIVEGYAAGVPSWPENKGSNPDHTTSHMLFVSPWRGTSIIGTFHSHYAGVPGDFQITEDQLHEILREANSAYPGANLVLEDIKFVHYGFLPEKINPQGVQVRLIRKSRVVDHHKQDGLPGLISVMGVKYTTARHAAEKVVDRVFEKLEKKSPSCETHSTQIFGGQIGHLNDFLRDLIQADVGRLTPEAIEHLGRSYGTQYSKIIGLVGDQPTGSPLTKFSEPVLKAQVLYAIREEMAISLCDVIFRRTGIGTVGMLDDPTLQFIAATMASELDWSLEKLNSEKERLNSYYGKHGIEHLIKESPGSN